MSKENSGSEKRKFVRLPEQDLLVCEPFDIADFAGTGKIAKRMHAFTKSLSEGGILFESDEPFEIGALLKLELDIPGWEKYKPEFYRSDIPSGRHPLIILGKVVRIEDIGQGVFDIGVAFTAVDDGHKLALKKYLESAGKGRQK